MPKIFPLHSSRMNGKNKFFSDCKLEWQHQVESKVHGNTISLSKNHFSCFSASSRFFDFSLHLSLPSHLAVHIHKVRVTLNHHRLTHANFFLLKSLCFCTHTQHTACANIEMRRFFFLRSYTPSHQYQHQYFC